MTPPCAGINSFGHMVVFSNVSVVGSGGNSGNQYILTNLATTLQNPSNISLQTNDVSLAVFFKDVKIRQATINVCSLTCNVKEVLILPYRP
jgi:hypothetical protein